MPTHTWKNRERQIAGILKTNRTPLSGSSSRHTSSDTLHEKLYIECKYRKRHPILHVSTGPIVIKCASDGRSWVLWHYNYLQDVKKDGYIASLKTKTRKRWATVGLWLDTAEKAKKENKLPVVALFELYQRGFWLFCLDSDIQSISKEFLSSNE